MLQGIAEKVWEQTEQCIHPVRSWNSQLCIEEYQKDDVMTQLCGSKKLKEDAEIT